MTEIILHGALGRRFGRRHLFNIGKPIDAVRALMANKKGFRRALKSWGREGKLYEVICDGKLIDTEQEFINSQRIEKIEIVPTIMGTSGVVKFVVGVILIVVGVIVSPFAPFIGKALITVGASLVIGGVLEMLFPVQTPSFHTEAAGKSFLFSGVTNTTSRGGPVQVGYGRMRVGSQVISTALEPSRFGGANNELGERPMNPFDPNKGILAGISYVVWANMVLRKLHGKVAGND